MPFPKQYPRAFSRANIEALNPNQLGVYGIFKQSKWIYVGKGDICRRLLDHLYGDNPCIISENPTDWVDEITVYMDAREKELIAEFNPVCNKRAC